MCLDFVPGYINPVTLIFLDQHQLGKHWILVIFLEKLGDSLFDVLPTVAEDGDFTFSR